MLLQTSELAIKALIRVVLAGGDSPISPRRLAQQIEASPSYMAKVCNILVKANILRARRGTAGGVFLKSGGFCERIGGGF